VSIFNPSVYNLPWMKNILPTLKHGADEAILYRFYLSFTDVRRWFSYIIGVFLNRICQKSVTDAKFTGNTNLSQIVVLLSWTFS